MNEIDIRPGANLETMTRNVMRNHGIDARDALRYIAKQNRIPGWPTTFEMVAQQIEAE